MKTFLYKFLIFSSILFLSFLTIIILNRYYSNFKIDNNKQLLIIGNSHPECAFNDSLINGFANYSNSGESYFYTYFKAKLLLHQNPHINHVFIEYENNQIEKEMDEWIWGDDKMSYRFPRYATFMDISSLQLLLEKNPTCFKESLTPWFKYNLKRALNGLEYSNEMGGYLYLVRDKTDSILANSSLDKDYTDKSLVPSLSPKNIEYLYKIISYCKQNNIKVTLIRSPLHKKYSGWYNEVFFQKILKKQFSNIDFLDFSKFPALNSEFADLGHLNYRGAAKFSVWFDYLIKNGLLNKADKQSYIDSEIKARISNKFN